MSDRDLLDRIIREHDEYKAEIERLRREVQEARAVLRDAYVGLSFAFNRLHGSGRSRDTELCGDFAKIRAKIEATGALKDRAP